jgi:hypothetical protein
MAPQWKVVASTSYTPVEPPPEPFAIELRGDKSVIVLPLRWPLSKALEIQLFGLRYDRLFYAFGHLLPGRDDEPKFPASDDELLITRPDGSPYPLSWHEPGREGLRGETWEWLYRWWYVDQDHFGPADLVNAFGDAIEVLTGLPLEQSAPLLKSSIPIAPTGPVDSGPTGESTSNES